MRGQGTAARGRPKTQLLEGVSTVRKLVLLTVVAVVSITAVAYAVTDTVSYSAKYVKSGKPSSKKPANLTYTGILHVDTNPPGSQPDTAPTTSIFYSKAIKNNAAHFPFCNQKDIDGQGTFPAKCNKAIVGTGTASSLAGTPGNPSNQSVREDLTVKAVNGPSGKAIFLVLTSKPGAPVAINNRVVPGAVVKGAGAFGFVTRFQVPADLQNQLGLSIALTDFNVKISGTPRTVKVNGKSVKESYLQLTSCPGGGLPAKAVATFKDSNGGPDKNVQSDSNAKC
jgi:hypothetical protein